MPLKLVIVGAGPAGFRAAEVLRQHAPDAEITLIGDEPHPPYQRPPLSKAYLTDGLATAALLLQPESFYGEQRISLRLGTRTTGINRAAKHGASVTVLELALRLMGRAMPPIVSDFARGLHERHGVHLELGIRIEVIEATGGGLVVRTEQGQHVCDLLLAGVGAIPNTELAADAGLVVDDGIRVDAHGRTSDPAIYAAGDVTRHDNPILGRAIRIESWQVALNQAAVVARCMLGAPEPYAELPWMWTDQYDCNIQALGLPSPDADLIVRGDPAAGKFTVLELGT